MHHLYIITIICLFIPSVRGGEQPDRLFMDDSPRQHEIPDERPRKMAWAEETDKKESDKKQLTYALYTHAFNAHIQRRLHMELAQATTLPTALICLITEYAPHQLTPRILPIHAGTVTRLMYKTDTTACSYSTVPPWKTWNIKDESIIATDNSAPLIQERPWQLASEEKAMQFCNQITPGEQFAAYAISPNKRTIAACSVRGFYIWEASLPLTRAKNSGKALYRPTPTYAITALTFSPCNNYLFAGSHEGQVYVFNLRTKERVCTLMHSDSITQLACKSDGSEILVGSVTGKVYVWEGMSFDLSFVADKEDVFARPQQQIFSDTDPMYLTPMTSQPLDYSTCKKIAHGYYMKCAHYAHRPNNHAAPKEQCLALLSCLSAGSCYLLYSCPGATGKCCCCLLCSPLVALTCVCGCVGAMTTRNSGGAIRMPA